MAAGRCVVQNANIKSKYNETQGLLEARFIAILDPAGSSCFLFVCLFVASFLISGTFNLKIYVDPC